MTDGLRIAHLRIAPQWAILRWAILTFTDPFAQRASGRPPGPDFGPKICIFLRYAYITPIFLGRTDPTQWDHKSPIS